ncbi:RluA family pseudouridine synthase [Acetivibrio mesophilus]|uniref:Pseudouridine synthase n=1 Tax=Acetivibrio mesophilus TaxID=2487273 RepID=A0A4Q0I7A6_9FIRM|nr:RluA family pseudouridine synthase [Acetivibrio mesophilus]ODM25237.1 RNA pseudouridine synthase [Clostridium sp. Bc-iso-3]RXE59745.1 RluA family pseudouridine synthase [Acetivibrio mesophilus]HHV29714.1 RluA family pseudouridine synthase [Clostridium sp.]
MEEIIFISEDNGIRIDAWLCGKLKDYSRSYIQKLVNDEMILVNGKPVKSNYKLKPKDEILAKIPSPQVLDVEAEDISVPILYEDEDIVVVDKPKGMVVHPAAGNYSGTLVNALLNHCGDNLSDINGIIRPGIVHRIDKDTSGVLVVAKSNTAHEGLSRKLKDHDIERVYVALVHGIIREEQGKIDAPIGRHPVDRKKMAVNTKNGRRAVTHFKVLERFKDATYIEVTLETGRTHQIRVHMSYIGYPIIGDTVYGKKNDVYDINGQALHAKKLGFIHPIKGEYMEFESPVPEYFKELLAKM